MAEPTLRAVLCPCCKQLLYALEASEGGWQLSKGSPAIANDKNGPYMKCPRCARRIAMLKSRESAERGDPPFSIATKQGCDQILS